MQETTHINTQSHTYKHKQRKEFTAKQFMENIIHITNISKKKKQHTNQMNTYIKINENTLIHTKKCIYIQKLVQTYRQSYMNT